MNRRLQHASRLLVILLGVLCLLLPPAAAGAAVPGSGQVEEDLAEEDRPEKPWRDDQGALEKLQRAAFLYMWEYCDPDSGMAAEANFDWGVRPAAVGGSGFGVAAVVVATERGWITREEALDRLLTITRFLRDKTPRHELHGAFPHWLNGKTGAVIKFGDKDVGADLVETSLLMQGLLIARAYFNGPGSEAELRAIITGLWEDVDWNWFTAGQESGLFWHWSTEHGHSGLKILGYNECLITYVLAMASPTHPISRQAYDYWTSGDGYKPKNVYGYTVEAALPGAGPLFLTHYSFIGLDPRRMADEFVPGGYFARNMKQVLGNRGYCLQNAPARNRYGEGYWGLTASQVKTGYAAGEPLKDSGTVAPTAALSSMPYTPHYAMQVLEFILEGAAIPAEEAKDGSEAALRRQLWGPYGPHDAYSLRDKWVSSGYLAIDQLPMVCMVENYRSGLLWNLLMADPDIRNGLARAGIHEPVFATGFPEAVVTLKKNGKKYEPDAYDIRRHPDTGLYVIPYWVSRATAAKLTLTDDAGAMEQLWDISVPEGRNYLSIARFEEADGAVFTLTLTTAEGEEAALPVRFN